MKNVSAILFQLFLLFALAACSSSPLKDVPEPGREPAQAAGLSLRNEKQGSIVCVNQEHTPGRVLHYVVQLRQRKGGENGPWTWIESGDVAVVEDYTYGSDRDSYGNFLARIEMNSNTIRITGAPPSVSSPYYSSRPLVSKSQLKLQWSVDTGGVVSDPNKARPMSMSQSPISCFQPRMQYE